MFQPEERQQWKLEKDSELRIEIPEGKGKAQLVVRNATVHVYKK